MYNFILALLKNIQYVYSKRDRYIRYALSSLREVTLSIESLPILKVSLSRNLY